VPAGLPPGFEGGLFGSGNLGPKNGGRGEEIGILYLPN